MDLNIKQFFGKINIWKSGARQKVPGHDIKEYNP